MYRLHHRLGDDTREVVFAPSAGFEMPPNNRLCGRWWWWCILPRSSLRRFPYTVFRRTLPLVGTALHGTELTVCVGRACPQAGDEFTSELVRIHETIEAEGGPRQPVCLAINRSDYMLHVPEDGVTDPHLLQVSGLLASCRMRKSTAAAIVATAVVVVFLVFARLATK